MELIYGEGIVALKGPESLQQRMIQAVLEHNRTEPIRIEGTDAHAMTDLMVLLMIMGCSSEFLDDVLERLWNAQVRSTNKQPDFFDVFRQYPTGKLLIRDHGREFK